MRIRINVFVAAIVLLLSQPCFASTLLVPGTAGSGQRSTGVNGENLDDDPRTDTIPHKDGGTVFFNAFVAAGTTTTVTVSCEESPDGTNWTWIHSCDDGVPQTCVVAAPVYDVTVEPDFTVEVWSAQAYLRCTFFGSAGGTGTIIVRGSIPGN